MSEAKVKVFRSSVTKTYRNFTGTPFDSRKTFEAGAIVTPQQSLAVDAVEILNEVWGIAKANMTLRNICRVIPMDALKMTIDIASGSTVEKKVPPMTAAKLASLRWLHVNFDLWKNVGKVGVAIESELKSRHPQMQLNKEQVGYDLAYAENEQIAEVIEAATSKAATSYYSDWGALSSGISSTNPLTAITAHCNVVEKAVKRPVDFMVMHPTLCDKFVQNTHIVRLIHAGMAQFNENSTQGYFKMPNRPAIKVFTDLALTETPTTGKGPILGASTAPAVVLGDGPLMAMQYFDNDKMADYYQIAQWLEPKIGRSTAISQILSQN